ncbi:LAFE_0G09538g1_1 [Lachancea fermentati]|uniref:LAFE_0G09538g1_1 n=1 Tax=Lachancea fermentati TaxID=4955 RepID=A0A1G4MHM4_LACFM|nr:LAFE_0G09538g1_1 [Lachancea fermentati]
MSLTSQQKTQILITDVPREDFVKGWSQQLEKELFEVKFPDLKSKCEYYTPLAFLSRIVIIFEDEASTLQVYEYLNQELKSRGVKLYLTESLLARPRSKSMDDPVPSKSEKPILAIDTGSSVISSPTLSPERACGQSPTAMRFPEDGKVHYYQEPAPRPEMAEEPKPQSGKTTYLYKPDLKLDVAGVRGGSYGNSPPMSPSITLNEFTH